MKITTIGIDLAKAVFQVHGVDEGGKAVLRKQVKRKDVLSFFANLLHLYAYLTLSLVNAVYDVLLIWLAGSTSL